MKFNQILNFYTTNKNGMKINVIIIINYLIYIYKTYVYIYILIYNLRGVPPTFEEIVRSMN